MLFLRPIRRSQAIFPAHHQPTLSTAYDPTPLAFAFDIDGVLIRGKHVLQTARTALARLFKPHAPGTPPTQTHPLVFLTNGGGVPEATKAAQLTQWLGQPITEDHIVLSHTPFKSIVGPYKDSPVLVLGRNRAADVARLYGLQHVVTTQQLAAAFPHAVPFAGGAYEEGGGLAGGTVERPISAVFVFNDPSDWYCDLQLTVDVLVGGGVIGRAAQPPHTSIPIYFSNPDLLWANEHPTPRFGQGAFKAALEGLYLQLTGLPLPHVRVFGKPNPEPYRLAEALLLKQWQGMGHHQVGRSRHHIQVATRLPFSAIYAIGDNPAADVRGANAAGGPWVSVLVHTGVFQPTEGVNNCQRDPAQIVVSDVDAAVAAALHRQRSMGWHALR